MPSNYSATPNASQTPSAAPGPGVQPTLSLPVDADALNSASIYQPFKALDDSVGYVHKSVQLSPGRVPGVGVIGYTAPVYSSFGGTLVANGGTIKISNGTNFVVKIVTGGAVATAQFQTSLDGGNTFGATQTTAASMTDATSGIQFLFTGTFTLNGTAQFFSAFTPQAAWADSSGNLRAVVSASGFPMGGMRSEIREEFRNSTVNNGVVTNYGQLSGVIVGTGTLAMSDPTAAIPARNCVIGAGSVGGDLASISTSGKTFINSQSFIEGDLEFQFSMTAVGVGASSDWYLGLSDSTTPGVATNQIQFRKLHNVANWFGLSKAGGGTSVTDLGVAPVAGTVQRFKLRLGGSTTSIGGAYASPWVLFFINEQLVGTISTNITTAAMFVTFGGLYSTGAGGETGSLSPWLFCWNRTLSLPQL